MSDVCRIYYKYLFQSFVGNFYKEKKSFPRTSQSMIITMSPTCFKIFNLSKLRCEQMVFHSSFWRFSAFPENVHACLLPLSPTVLINKYHWIR